MQDVHGWWGMRGLGILFWILVMLAIARTGAISVLR